GGAYTNGATMPSPAGNFRSMKSFGGTVYVCQSSDTEQPVSTISAPSGGIVTPLPGLSAATKDTQDFYLVSSGSNGSAYDVLYIITDSTSTTGMISKYSLVGGSWTFNGSYATVFGGFSLAAEP